MIVIAVLRQSPTNIATPCSDPVAFGESMRYRRQWNAGSLSSPQATASPSITHAPTLSAPTAAAISV